MIIKDIIENIKDKSHGKYVDYDIEDYNFNGTEICKYEYISDFFISMVKGYDGKLYICSYDEDGDGFKYKWSRSEQEFEMLKDCFSKMDELEIIPILIILLLEAFNIEKRFNLK
jgi:hypothetical protein